MRRNRIDIIIDVLDVARMGVNKTSVVYKSNLNFKMADKYLEFLEKQGLLENRVDKYITTDKGIIFLEKAREIIQQLKPQSQIQLF